MKEDRVQGIVRSISVKIWTRRRCLLKILLICSLDCKGLCNFGKEHYGDESCEIILNFDQ